LTKKASTPGKSLINSSGGIEENFPVSVRPANMGAFGYIGDWQVLRVKERPGLGAAE